jgi:hypothetical protein
VGKSGERFFVKALSSLFWKKFWIFFRRGVMEAYKFRFSASQSGTEKVFEGGKWVRRQFVSQVAKENT